MAATTFQSDDSGDVKNTSSPGQSPPIVKDPADALSSAPVSVEEQTSSVPEILAVSDDSGTEGQVTDTGGGSNKKTVWNKPSNGVVEVVSPVMGAVSWPALGDFSKSSSPKSGSSESLKALADGPLPPALQSVRLFVI